MQAKARDLAHGRLRPRLQGLQVSFVLDLRYRLMGAAPLLPSVAGTGASGATEDGSQWRKQNSEFFMAKGTGKS